MPANDSHGANLAQRDSITIDPKCQQEINQELSNLHVRHKIITVTESTRSGLRAL
jgi:hypothetical protein